MEKMTFILGGARSGKSTYARHLAGKYGGRVLFIATATASDDEMTRRIAMHQRERPTDWATREIPKNIAAVLRSSPPHADVILLDCVTLLINNLLLEIGETEPEEKKATNLVTEEMESLVEFIHASEAQWIIVSNEVGLGLVPPYPLGRIYRDLLGYANQKLASSAEEVFWMAAGIAIPIHQFKEAAAFDRT